MFRNLNVRFVLFLALVLALAATVTTLLALSLSAASHALSSPYELGSDTTFAATTAPTITLSTYYGGTAEECVFEPCAVAVDKDGNIYVVGTTGSDDFPLTNPYTTTFTAGSGSDIFMVKIAAETHTVLYSTYLAPGVARGIAVDGDGNAYVTGYTSSDSFPTTPDAVHTSYQGVIDAVVAKLSSDGSQLLYGSYLGGSNRDEGFDIAVDGMRNIYLTGYTSSDDFDTANAHQATYGGSIDAFITKIAANGSLAYSSYLGGSSKDEGWGITIDGGGNAYITGHSSSDDFDTTPGVVQSDRFSGAGSDAIVSKMTASGALSYSTFYNTTGANNGVDIAVDAQGDAYVISTHEDVFKLNADASAVVYQTEFDIQTNVGGEGGIAVDSDGSAYVTGWRGSGGNKDIVVAVLAANGIVVYNQSIGGTASDYGYSIAVYEDGAGHKSAYVAGNTLSDDFPTVNPIQPTLKGVRDLVIVQIDGMEDLPRSFLYLPLVIR